MHRPPCKRRKDGRYASSCSILHLLASNVYPYANLWPAQAPHTIKNHTLSLKETEQAAHQLVNYPLHNVSIELAQQDALSHTLETQRFREFVAARKRLQWLVSDKRSQKEASIERRSLPAQLPMSEEQNPSSALSGQSSTPLASQSSGEEEPMPWSARNLGDSGGDGVAKKLPEVVEGDAWKEEVQVDPKGYKRKVHRWTEEQSTNEEMKRMTGSIKAINVNAVPFWVATAADWALRLVDNVMENCLPLNGEQIVTAEIERPRNLEAVRNAIGRVRIGCELIAKLFPELSRNDWERTVNVFLQTRLAIMMSRLLYTADTFGDKWRSFFEEWGESTLFGNVQSLLNRGPPSMTQSADHLKERLRKIEECNSLHVPLPLKNYGIGVGVNNAVATIIKREGVLPTDAALAALEKIYEELPIDYKLLFLEGTAAMYARILALERCRNLHYLLNTVRWDRLRVFAIDGHSMFLKSPSRQGAIIAQLFLATPSKLPYLMTGPIGKGSAFHGDDLGLLTSGEVTNTHFSVATAEAVASGDASSSMSRRG